jgi:hypothetical protein
MALLAIFVLCAFSPGVEHKCDLDIGILEFEKGLSVCPEPSVETRGSLSI